jgi:hypothetical protein
LTPYKRKKRWIDGMVRNTFFMRLFVISRVDRVISQFWREKEDADL